MKYKVLVTDYVWPSLDPERSILNAVEADLIVAPSGDEQTLIGLARDCDAILTCFAKVTGRVIDAATRCRIIARYGVGLDNIDVETATRKGIVVTNVPTYCVDEVAEHSLALLMACSRKVVFYDRRIRKGDWSTKDGIPIFRLRGQTLGIVGFGQIGRAVADRGRALGLKVLAHDPYQTAESLQAAGVEPVDFCDLLRRSDFVSLHLPLSLETTGIVGADALRQMKPTAFLINAARGGLVDIEALVLALEEKRIAGAGLDVLPQEPPPPDHPLRNMENVVLTPHSAFYSEQSLLELQTKAAEEVARVLGGKQPINIVNPAVVRKGN